MISTYPLGEICEVTMGQAPVGSSYNDKGEGFALLAGAGDFGDVAPEPKKHTTQPTRISKPNDLIICIRATIGDLNWSDGEYCLGRGVAGLRPIKGKLDKNYLWHFISSNKGQLESKGTGSTFKQVSRSHIEEWEIPLPPLEEQKRIAAILDKADAIRRKRQQAIDLTDQLLGSVFLDMFGDPLVNNKLWPVHSLSDVTKFVTDGKHGDCNDEEGSGYYFISAKDVYGGKIHYSKAREIVKTEFEEVHRRTDLEAGDIVMVNTGATIGKMAIVEKNEKTRKTTFQKSVAVIKLDTKCIFPEFLKYVFQLRINDFASKGTGSAVKNLLLSEMRRFPIILPPLGEQEKFQKILHHVERSTKVKTEFLAKSEETFQSIVQRAFRGDLCKQTEAA